ncbi:MAG: hypothetical protein RBG13Loki_0136 [Promethearchaeota archaeon CR_4]|nr:MAG: hypothetical protein RBG13Loki_0136 [Candidatus Lokiarchaeota archaeon CR_4]
MRVGSENSANKQQGTGISKRESLVGCHKLLKIYERKKGVNTREIGFCAIPPRFYRVVLLRLSGIKRDGMESLGALFIPVGILVLLLGELVDFDVQSLEF